MHPSHKHTYSSSICSQTPPPGISELIRTTTKGRSRIVLTWNGVCWCLLVSYVVWRCEEGVWGVFQSVSECCFKHNMDVCTVSWRLRVYLSVMALYGAANAHIGKSPKGKIPRTWHFWNIKIPKPPYHSCLNWLYMGNEMHHSGRF